MDCLAFLLGGSISSRYSMLVCITIAVNVIYEFYVSYKWLPACPDKSIQFQHKFSSKRIEKEHKEGCTQEIKKQVHERKFIKIKLVLTLKENYSLNDSKLKELYA